MDLEFLFGAGVGTAITGGVLQQIDKVKAQQIESMLLKATDYGSKGKNKEAISVLEGLIELNHLDPRIYIQLWGNYSQLATKEKRKANVLHAIDKALEYYDVILWLVRQGAFVPNDFLKGLEKNNAFLKVMRDVNTGKLQLVNDQAEEYNNKSDLAIESGNFKKALQYITKAIEVETNDVVIARYHAKRALIRKVLGDYTGASSDCRIALKCERLGNKIREFAKKLRVLRKLESIITKLIWQ